MGAYGSELVGTMLLVLLGDGVVANVLLRKSKGQDSGWIVIATGWGLAVALSVYAVGRISGAHINPAVTVGLASIGAFPWSQVPGYVIAQITGGFLGGLSGMAHLFAPLVLDGGSAEKVGRFLNDSGGTASRRESSHRTDRDGCPGVWSSRHRGQCSDADETRRSGSVGCFQPWPSTLPGWRFGLVHRLVTWRPNGLCH